MISSLTLSITVACVMTAGAALVQVVRRRYRVPSFVPTLFAIEAMLVALIVADVVGLVRGHRPAEFATHLAYLAVSLTAIPVTLNLVGEDDGPWSGMLMAVALAVLAVIMIRLQATWRSSGG